LFATARRLRVFWLLRNRGPTAGHWARHAK